VDGYALTAANTVFRPWVAQEHGADRRIWPFLKVEDVVEGTDGVIRIRCGLYGGPIDKLFRDHYVYRGNRAKALEDLPPELAQWKSEADAAQASLDALALATESVASAKTAYDAAVDKDAQRKKNKKPSRQTRNAKAAFDKAKRTAMGELRADKAHTSAFAVIDRWRAALDARALEFGDLHRDYYAYPMLRQPNQANQLSAQKIMLGQHGDAVTRGGTLEWTIAPRRDIIAGWAWAGWSQNIAVTLAEDQRATVVYQTGTWELGGAMDGLTAVNLRYRGLGGIEQDFTVDETGGIVEAFTTTELIPGAAGGAPLVSPVVPPSGKGGMDRGNALRHRIGAWICRMARGGGHHFFDFQYRPEAGFIAFPERQSDLRAVVEAMPEDQHLSHTDEQRFALSGNLVTVPMTYLALVDQDRPFTVTDWRSRWKEWDQHLREVVSTELGLVHPQPLPGVGILKEYGRPGFYRGMAKDMERWAGMGVRLVVSHTPGWWSPQHPDIAGKRGHGGNSNAIYDWKPTHDMHEPWKLFQAACAANDVRYHSYLTGMVRNDGTFFNEVGADDANWGRNMPGSDFSHGYPPILNGMGINSKRTSDLLDQRMMAVRETYGTQGIWADSYQNMYMSQLSWGDGSGAPQQRLWWEKLAQWSQAGILFMSESHALPGLSCSIEAPGWEEDLWYFQYVWKWHRGAAQNAYSPERLDELCFRAMANRGWTAPDGKPDVIPSFGLFANSYLAALPRMQRPYVLPDESGVLWLDAGSDRDSGVLFSFSEATLPDGIAAKHLVDGATLENRPAWRVLNLTGSDLLASFGIRTPPHADERPEIVTPEPVYPDWATQAD
jgi:hypothetical protein